MKPITNFLIRSSCLLFCSLIASRPTAAQVREDGTTSTTVTSSDGHNFTIEGGNRPDGGNNLFHSFQDFSVPTNGSAFFNNADVIENIFSRVTGGNISSIDGLIRANGSANLFLINPAGIIFGRNARLDIGGSFLGSTADSILFPNGEFSAVDLDNPPLLTINAPIGLGVRDEPAPITNQSIANDGVGLEVSLGENITLVGGDIDLAGIDISAPGGRVELGGLSAAGEIGIDSDGSLSFPNGIERGDVTLTNSARVFVRGGGGGSITVNARNIELSGGESGISFLLAGIAPDSGSTTAQAGDITLNATDTISVSQGSAIANQVDSTGEGNAGGINITTTDLFLTEGGFISASTFGPGNAGDLTVNASEEIALSSDSGIFAQVVGEQAVGTGGNVTLNTPNLSLSDGADISVSTSGEGNAGNLSIIATELVEVLGTEEPGTQSSIRANVFGENGTGDAGNLTIETKKLVIRSSQVSSSTSGQGNAGNLTVNASESVEISGKVFGIPDSGEPPTRNPAGLFSQVNTQGEGNGGNLTVETPRLSVGNGGKIQVAVFGKGNAGDLVIRASDIDIYDTPGKADFFEGGIFAGFQVDEDETIAPPEGDLGGTVTIETDRLRVRDGGAVTVFTEGNGNAGILQINAQDYIEVYGEVTGATTNRIFTSKISGEATANSTGSSGSVIIDTDKLIVRDRGKVTVSSENTSNPAGNLDITANSLSLNRGRITAETRVGQGEEGANITLKVSDLLTLRNESLISAEATENANGGNLTIDAEFIIASLNQNNDIIANAEQGRGGNINITAEGVFGLEERSSTPTNNTNDIDASSEFGLDGTVSINTPDLSTFQEAIEAPEIVQLPTLGASACSGVGETTASSFTITGKGGVPPEPTAPMNSDTIYKQETKDLCIHGSLH